MLTTVDARNPASQAAAHRLGGLLLTTGTLHFAAPQLFDTLVPAELPGPARRYTHVSGVLELGVAALILVPRTRRVGATAAAALFVGVSPANLNMVRLWWGRSWPWRIAAVLRQPFQIPLVIAALTARRNA